MASTHNITVSVVLCTYNRDAALCATLQQLLEQETAPLEILVIDSSEKHTENTTAYLKDLSRKKQIALYQIKCNLSAARNVGLKNARGDIVLMVDDDVVFDDRYIFMHCNNYIDASIDGVCGRIVSPDGSAKYVRPRMHFMFPYGPMHYPASNGKRENGYMLHGCNFSVRRQVALSVGGFDERLSMCEDMDFSWRLYQKNARIIFDPMASVTHMRSDHGGLAEQRKIPFEPTILYFTNYFCYYFRNYSFRYPGQTILLMVLHVRRGIITRRNIRKPHHIFFLLLCYIIALKRACIKSYIFRRKLLSGT